MTDWQKKMAQRKWMGLLKLISNTNAHQMIQFVKIICRGVKVHVTKNVKLNPKALKLHAVTCVFINAWRVLDL